MNEQERRRQHVYELLKTDLERQEIADSLYISLATVKRSIAEIYRDLDVHTRAEFREKAK